YPGSRGGPAPSILDDVSFTVERGRALTLVGPSGSGKSSLLRCLNRLVEPTSGTVRLDGRDIRSFDPRALRRRVAIVMQTGVLVGETVSRLRSARGLSIVAVTHQPELVRRLGGGLLYLVKGRVEAFESIDGPGAGAVADARLQAFLAGERIPSAASDA